MLNLKKKTFSNFVQNPFLPAGRASQGQAIQQKSKEDSMQRIFLESHF